MLKHNNKEISDKRVYKDVIAAHVTFMLLSLHLVYSSTIRPPIRLSVRYPHCQCQLTLRF